MASHARPCPCTSSKSSRAAGFTLVEVIVAITIALLVMVTVYFALYYASRSTAYTQVSLAREQELMKIFHQMRRQMTNLYVQEDKDCLRGEEGTREHRSEIHFLTTSMENRQGVGEVGYKMIQEDDGNTYLAYTEFPYPRVENRFAYLNPHQDKWTKMSTMIKQFEVEYRYQNQWRKDWQLKENPERIRVTLYYKENEEDEMYRKFKFIVTPGVKSIF